MGKRSSVTFNLRLNFTSFVLWTTCDKLRAKRSSETLNVFGSDAYICFSIIYRISRQVGFAASSRVQILRKYRSCSIIGPCTLRGRDIRDVRPPLPPEMEGDALSSSLCIHHGVVYYTALFGSTALFPPRLFQRL